VTGPAGEAAFHCLQLLEAVVELRPKWLPTRLFDLIMERWRHPDREARCAAASFCAGNMQRHSMSVCCATAPSLIGCTSTLST